MNQQEAHRLGVKARRGAGKLHPDLGDWDLFSRSFGFFQFKKKNNMTPEIVESFAKGFKGEPL